MEIKVGDKMLVEVVTPEHTTPESVDIAEQVVENISECGEYVKVHYNNWRKLDTFKILAIVKAEDEADADK